MAHTATDRFSVILPMDVETYFAVMEDNEIWQDDLDALLHDLGIDPQALPSIEEIQKELGRYIPYEDKLSDLIVTMREE
jgi:hypothetical protein